MLSQKRPYNSFLGIPEIPSSYFYNYHIFILYEVEEETTSGTVTDREVTKAAEPLGTKELYRKIEEFSEIIEMLSVRNFYING
jgi:hypothetical protein